MAKANVRLITALRETAHTLENPEVTYKWSSFAHCNCGHLVQTVTGLEPVDIQQTAMVQQRDWGQQAYAYNQTQNTNQFPQPDYGDDRPALDEGAWEPENVGACTLTGMSLDRVFATLLELGLDALDFQYLERLSDPAIRQRLGNHHTDFPHYEKQNVIDYLKAWADMLEQQLPIEAQIDTVENEIPHHSSTPPVAILTSSPL